MKLIFTEMLNKYKKLSYRRDSARCVKRPFKVTQYYPLLCQSTRIYDFLSALNSNLTSIFNRYWDITLNCTSIPDLSSRSNWKRWLGVDWYAWCFGVMVPRTLDYPTINLSTR